MNTSFLSKEKKLKQEIELWKNKYETTLLATNDRLFQAFRLSAVSPEIREAENVIKNQNAETPPFSVADLSVEQRNFYDDIREGFLRYETTENNRSTQEAINLWDAQFAEEQLKNVREQVY